MNMELPASPAPPSPIAPIEPGPHEPNAVFASNRAQPLLEEASSSTHVSKQDLERAILIECTELYVLVVEGDWRGLASLGLAMDLKHPISSYPLKNEHTPPHIAFLFPYLLSQLILGQSRAALVRLISLESIVSQHPVFQSLHTVAYALSNDSLSGVFPAITHLEQVIERTHDPRFDPEIKEIAQKGVKHLHRTHRARITQNISAAYTTIPASLLGKYLGFPEIEQEALQRYVRVLGWEYNSSAAQYRPRTTEGTKPTSTHLGFNDLNYLTASALALDTPL